MERNKNRLMSQRDPYLEQLIAEADARFQRRDYAGALETLNQADKDFPHQRDVLARREMCLKRLGRKAFAFGPEQKEKVRFSQVEEAVTWDRDAIVEGAGAPVRKISRQGSARPAMVDPHENLPAPPAPYVLERRKPNQLIPLLLLLAYLGVTIVLATRGPSPGDTQVFSGIAFVWIPPASKSEVRTLGADPDSAETLRRGFWISQTEISVPDWERIAHGRIMETEGVELLPKTGVSFVEAQEFAESMSRAGEGLYRLPTAAEWRWACLAGQTHVAEIPDHVLLETAWFADNSDYLVQPIAKRAPNPWSLYDMLGNAEEWVDTISPGNSDEASDRFRMLMGGSYRTFRSIIGYDTYATEDMHVPVDTAGLRLIREAGASAGNVQRVLSFPDDRPSGILYINGQPYGDAIGDVVVLENDRVSLAVYANHPADLAGLSQLKPGDLHGLTIQHPGVKPEAFNGIGHLTGLIELDLTRTPLPPGALAFLSRYSDLERLVLDETGVQATDLRALHDLVKLRRLFLRDNASIHSVAVDVLSDFEHLKTLDLTGTSLTSDELTDLQLAIPLCNVIPQPTEFTAAERLHRASLGGELSLLLHQFEPAAPPDRPFLYEGFQTRASLGAQENLSPGYWVYVAPYWCVWKYRGGGPRPGLAPWSPDNLVGEPAEQPLANGIDQWAPAAGVDERPWLLVEFGEYVQPRELTIYWTSEPYPIHSVVAFSDSGEGAEFANALQLYTEWGDHNVEHLDATVEFLKEHEDLSTNRFLITFEPVPADAAGQEPPLAIDAVALVSRFDRTQWVRAAGASSSFRTSTEALADDEEQPGLPGFESVDVVVPRFRGLLGLVESLFEQNDEEPSLID